MANYYDIDEIIVEEELVSAVFQKAANGVGILDPSAETNSAEQGSKVELPFWLAHELLLRQAVTINIPACFNQKTRKEIQADAPCVDLRSRCPYFYELGCKVAPLKMELYAWGVQSPRCNARLQNWDGVWAESQLEENNRESGEHNLEQAMIPEQAFLSRYKEVLSKAHTSASTPVPKVLTLLTKEETNLYETAQSSMAAFKKWRMGGPRFQRASVLGRKRKPTD